MLPPYQAGLVPGASYRDDDRTSPDIIREVEKVLERKTVPRSSQDFTRRGGVKAVVEILNWQPTARRKARDYGNARVDNP